VMLRKFRIIAVREKATEGKAGKIDLVAPGTVWSRTYLFSAGQVIKY